NRSFLVNTYFPFFNAFFNELGYRVVLPDSVDSAGKDQQAAAFCFPAEIAHGFIANLVTKDPNILFLPHIRGVPTDEENQNTCTCVFVQGEAFYLATTFEAVKAKRTITPYLDLSRGFESKIEEFVQVAEELGLGRAHGKRAFNAGMAAQKAFKEELRARGAEVLKEIEQDPSAM